jgi:hypothetical protein
MGVVIEKKFQKLKDGSYRGDPEMRTTKSGKKYPKPFYLTKEVDEDNPGCLRESSNLKEAASFPSVSDARKALKQFSNVGIFSFIDLHKLMPPFNPKAFNEAMKKKEVREEISEEVKAVEAEIVKE